MRQVLFHIPIRIPNWLPDGIPIYGYGMMLFLAFLLSTWVAGRRAQKAGIAPARIQDLAIWVFVFGIGGARITYMIVEGVPWTSFFKLWDGGLIFYGSAIGGAIGFILAYVLVIRKYHLSSWTVLDIVAPSVALGLCLGRLGCLLNGCCYGNVACPDCTFQSHFPLSAPPRYELVQKGYQTAAGFSLSEMAADPRAVAAVDPSSAMAEAGLQAGDIILAVNETEVKSPADIDYALGLEWPRGRNDLTLKVERAGKEILIGPAKPLTIGLHPTQLYSSIGNFIMFCLLLAFSPLKNRDGQVITLLLFCYPIHRFLIECLRNDTKRYVIASWWPVMTLSQNISIALFASAIVMALFVSRRPKIQAVAK
jgi:phosphatidylglycerol---prolipoprotein diacylglyceryl transferase